MTIAHSCNHYTACKTYNGVAASVRRGCNLLHGYGSTEVYNGKHVVIRLALNTGETVGGVVIGGSDGVAVVVVTVHRGRCHACHRSSRTTVPLLHRSVGPQGCDTTKPAALCVTRPAAKHLLASTAHLRPRSAPSLSLNCSP